MCYEKMSHEIMIAILLIVLSIHIPMVKVPTYLYILNIYKFPDTLYKNIPDKLLSTFRHVSRHYFFWQFGVVFGVSFFMREKPDLEWFTFHTLFYNIVVYQSFLLSQFVNYPLIGIAITTYLQYLDKTPILYAFIDNIANVYNLFSLSILPEKLFFYVCCLLIKAFMI